MSYFVHETAIIDKHVTIGEDTKVWHFSHILSHTTIGSHCSFGQNCVVGPKVIHRQWCEGAKQCFYL